MQIRSEQLALLDKAAKKRFFVSVKDLLKRYLPRYVQYLSDEDLLDHISSNASAAAQHGIVSEAGIARFACLSIAFGPSFTESAKIQALLSHGGRSPDQTLELLLDACAQEAKRRANA